MIRRPMKYIVSLWIFFSSLIGFIIVSETAFAQHLHLEKFYQASWCAAEHGQMEYTLDDGARVDCLTDEYAIEFDFAPKWAESIGQALYYAEKTGKNPGIVLILETEKDRKYLDRLNAVAGKHGITVWTMSQE